MYARRVRVAGGSKFHLAPGTIGGEKKYVFHAVGFVDAVGHVSEDSDEAFDELLGIF